MRRRRAQGAGKTTERETLQHPSRQRLRPVLRVGPDGHRPGAALTVIEGDHFAHEQELGLGKERIGAEALRQPFGPGGAPPAEIADVASGKRRQVFAALYAFRVQGAPKRLQRIRLSAEREARAIAPDAHVAVPSERSFEQERVLLLLFVEEAEDAERRQQITGKFDGRGRSASKAGSGKGSAWTGRLERMPTRCKHMIEAPAWRRPRGASRPRC